MKKRTRVALLFGGRSAEHEVSLISARNVAAAIDRRKYDIVAIGIDKQGRWFFDDGLRILNGRQRVVQRNGQALAAVAPGLGRAPLLELRPRPRFVGIDVVFPVLHGPFGEDGTVQGLLKLAGLPFVGAGVLGSAVGMDKDVMKRLMRDARLPVPKFLVFERGGNSAGFDAVQSALGLPVFVKPANLGSSIGISKARTKNEFERALREAFRYDNKCLVEAFVDGREIECSVLGNENPVASLPGEIVPRHGFYSYRAKYLDPRGADLIVPAELPAPITRRVRELAIEAFRALCCQGMARVDFFLRRNGEVLINEINTIPGFTQISMYPKLWEASGLGYAQLIDRLISLALERHRQEKRLRTSF